MATDVSAHPARPVISRAVAPQARSLGWAGVCGPLALGCAAGLLHALAWLFPGTWYTAWLGQAAFIGLAMTCRPRAALLYGSLGGALGIGVSFYWGLAALQNTFDASPLTAAAVFLALVALEAAGIGAFCWAVSIASRRGAAALWFVPVAWVAIEHCLPRVFPWKLGYSQLEVLPLLQIAELVGPAGIGFVVTAAATIPAALLLSWRGPAAQRRAAMMLSGVAGLLLVATLFYGQMRMAQWSEWIAAQPKLRVGLIQVDPAFVGSEHKLRERSLEVHDQVDLLCWPELSVGTYSEELRHFRDRQQTELLSRQSRHALEPARDFACHLLASGKLYRQGAGEEGPYAMTAFLISPEQDVVGRYRKQILLPFGEYIPGEAWFQELRHWAGLYEKFEAGHDASPVTMTGNRKLGVVLCYEDTLVSGARKTVARGAEALFSLIQGTSFENRLTLVQHQRLAALRAVENRRYFVRCSSTGMTCVIDPVGRVVAQLPPQVEATLQSEICLIRGRTLFNRLGDGFPLVCTAIAVCGLVVLGRRERASD
jgi:apolipoprotein N-acyltransferase